MFCPTSRKKRIFLEPPVDFILTLKANFMSGHQVSWLTRHTPVSFGSDVLGTRHACPNVPDKNIKEAVAAWDQLWHWHMLVSCTSHPEDSRSQIQLFKIHRKSTTEQSFKNKTTNFTSGVLDTSEMNSTDPCRCYCCCCFVSFCCCFFGGLGFGGGADS